MLNAINDTSNIIGQKVNDPAAMVLAVGRAQSVAQQNAAWLNAGKVAEQALPVFRNVIEAITYALFPLLVLLMLLTSGRETMLAFKGYAAVLIWIQLWPPLYAVLNYMASIYAAYDLAAAADLGSGAKALSLQTASTIYSRAISGEAVVGYLAISIPFIAWAALKRMETFGTALVGGLSGLQSMVAGATAGAAAGNLSMGNVSMDQIRLAPNRTSAFMSNWQNDISGNTFSSNMLTGRTAVSLLRNQGYASRVVSMRVSEQDVQDASRQVDAARSEAVAASTERSAVLSEAFTKGLAKLKSSRSSTGSTSSSFEQLGQTIDRLDQISRSVSESTGLTQSQVARIALGVTGHAGFNARFVGAQLNASADKTYLSGLSADERKVLGALTSEQASEFKQFGDRVSRDSSVASLVATDAREARELSSRIATTTARSARADASLADRTAFSERLAVARERGDSISIDIAQDPYNLAMFTRYAEQYGGTSASAQQLLSAELARQALAPTRNFSDGTGMPSSFDDVRHLYTTNSGDPRLTPDIDATYRRATGAVRQAPVPVAPPAQPAPEPSDARLQIQKSSDDLRGRTAARRQEFDDERSPARADDGTISPRQSLFKGTARQVARDAAETFQDAKDAVKGIIKR
ncbi:IncF plasmid conjugative transfer protein TraG [Piscinibacter sakaiensis]|uniref:IncF plasmid conjugative transfer protein TraG n=1 Tax=Piscinibacter sakaiensis TaxID=1547922 RepID=A0A0K8NTK4_PISS1|nr:IncF plasmid conjugative transfer protein TraG [Piscinibacter sakaiensis]